MVPVGRRKALRIKAVHRSSATPLRSAAAPPAPRSGLGGLARAGAPSNTATALISLARTCSASSRLEPTSSQPDYPATATGSRARFARRPRSPGVGGIEPRCAVRGGRRRHGTVSSPTHLGVLVGRPGGGCSEGPAASGWLAEDRLHGSVTRGSDSRPAGPMTAGVSPV